jgi:NAD+ kinase
MAAVVLCLHPDRASVVDVAASAADWLLERGHEVRLSEEDAATADLTALGVGRADLLDGADLAVSLGGDGTMLRTVDLVADAGIPVIGVNLGTLGYLTEVEPQHVVDALARFLAGDHSLQTRMRLSVEVDASAHEGPGSSTVPALNEAVVGKTPTGQIVRVRVLIDGAELTTYAADGIIIATPTGSTAYAWSAGGPIVSPDHAALLLTPVAPHMLFDRSLVLPPSSTIRLEIASDRPATLSVDGRNLGLLHEGDAVVCTVSPLPATIVTFEPRNFLAILKAKFRLDDRSED